MKPLLKLKAIIAARRKAKSERVVNHSSRIAGWKKLCTSKSHETIKPSELQEKLYPRSN